jgi:penicillin-insensitive murein endopeptidase
MRSHYLAIAIAASMITPSAAQMPVAKEVFGNQKGPAPIEARAIGSYARGCLAGAKALPVDGPAWQAMRLSRNRNWGHPLLIGLLEKLAVTAKENDGWPGLLVGDLAQPMGGPMLTGHASHQIGLDADVWLNPMPDRKLTRQERENRSAVSMLAEDQVSVDPKLWTPEHAKLIKRAAGYPEVARIFVHPAIKKTLCDWADEKERAWLSKVRPWWGHHYHFHIRMSCPPGSSGCVDQPAVGSDDGCGKEVKNWLRKVRPPKVVEKPAKPAKPAPPKRQMTIAELPDACAELVGIDLESIKTAVPGTPVPVPARKPFPVIPDRKPTESG